jgi:hypothetical protein
VHLVERAPQARELCDTANQEKKNGFCFWRGHAMLDAPFSLKNARISSAVLKLRESPTLESGRYLPEEKF